jgi:EAL domain-containing protein (putative c-di-GMP-specific phosphodiesterase class I)
MTSDPVDAAIVEATIRLAHSIGSRVVAEGIEDHTTWSSLVANRCELVQGYALSRPLPAAELEALLRAEPVPRRVTSDHPKTRRAPAPARRAHPGR